MAEVVRVGELVGRDQPRTHRAEAGERLAERELAAAGPLHDALGEVLADGEAGDVVPGRSAAATFSARAPITTTSSTSQSTVAVGSRTSANGPVRQVGNLVNVGGSAG